jgi:CRISPR-associated protein Csx16
MTTWFISRHPGAIDWTAAQGLPVDHHASHLDPAQVQVGDSVNGTLPVHLAAVVFQRGAQFFNLSLDLPAPWRGRELSADELRQCNAPAERL